MSDVPHYFLYGETVPSHSLDYLHIAALEESLPKHDWKIHPHRHNNLHQLLVVEEGSVMVQLRDLRSEERGYCILSIPPKEVHSFMHKPGVRGYIVTIVDSFLRGIFAANERQQFPFLFNECLIVRPDPDSKISWDFEMLMRQIMREYRVPRRGQACAIGAYLKVLFVLLSRSSSQMQVMERQYDAKISVYEDFVKLLETNYPQHWSVNQYADTLGMTGNRLNRLCQRYAGQNALQIVHERLLTEAKRKLIYSNMSVNEISYELGFKDPAYFSRFFTKSCDETPGQFKKRLQTQEADAER
ncbi:helix-turn-helix domain-containing protein [Thiothrix subterranea]|uniref:Helix-turn-helix domain-containing protein n=1 Tax=Thiothrix subterranea TaxID=2735563 RepID=A0AA51MM89_9GAMM|nr:helix-turn-helix domain-containing protein [Thiothrix subterranea]MDQ5769296.1 helix-turn-helix domain-containing protein [Thiothrix subterranea]WML86279.1 helix-turn-helix domain-containing protein [Thiothrix subterranea]